MAALAANHPALAQWRQLELPRLARHARQRRATLVWCGQIRLPCDGAPQRLAVRFSAGLAPDWAALPPGLRHGVIRLAAELYRDRTETGTARTPPAAVAALWRPWRGLCLA